ncbi:MAG TPA: hypothetical protein VM938_10780 [Acidimicrobiales bacterium]|nr:hypothetical protein [Acidimicrobiales bacterium]
MTTPPNPRRGITHIFVVVRIDDYCTSERIEDHLSLVSAFYTEAKADAEAERLNELKQGKSSRYTVVVSRLKETRDAAPTQGER